MKAAELRRLRQQQGYADGERRRAANDERRKTRFHSPGAPNPSTGGRVNVNRRPNQLMTSK